MRFEVTFYAPASRWDTSMDDRFARALAGSYGKGSLEVTDEGLVVNARRHRYVGNLIGGGIFAAGFGALGVLLAMQGSKHDTAEHLWVWLFFGALIGAFLTSLLFRFTKPSVLHVPWSNIQRFKTIAGRGRIFCHQGGDVELMANPQDWLALQQAGYARGIPCA